MAPIFVGKDMAHRVQGIMTDVGKSDFEAGRKRLAQLAGTKSASDGDTIEFLARGEADTIAYLQRKARAK